MVGISTDSLQTWLEIYCWRGERGEEDCQQSEDSTISFPSGIFPSGTRRLLEELAPAAAPVSTSMWSSSVVISWLSLTSEQQTSLWIPVWSRGLTLVGWCGVLQWCWAVGTCGRGRAVLQRENKSSFHSPSLSLSVWTHLDLYYFTLVVLLFTGDIWLQADETVWPGPTETLYHFIN